MGVSQQTIRQMEGNTPLQTPNKPFDMFVYSYTAESEVLDQLIQDLIVELELMRPKKHSLVLRVVLMNLIYSGHELVGLYRANCKVAQRINPDQVGQQALRAVLDSLEKAGYIGSKKGSKSEKRITLIWQTERLKNLLRGRSLEPYWLGGDLQLIRRLDPVVLKSRCGKEVDYQDTAYTVEVREFLMEYEEFLELFDIGYRWDSKDEWIAPPFNIRRSFNHGSFYKGGRISSPWTRLNKDARRTLTINDFPTSEVDMPCSSVNLMYRLATGKPYQEGDAYQVTVEGIPVPRPFSKKFLSIAQNTTGRGVQEAFQKELVKMGREEEFFQWFSISKLQEALLHKHHLIKQYLFKPSVGMKLQWAESELVYLVLKKLTEQGIPALTIYDAFLVRELDESKVRDELNSVANGCVPTYLRNFISTHN